jgi:hypothetical protein
MRNKRFGGQTDAQNHAAIKATTGTDWGGVVELMGWGLERQKRFT